MTHRTRLFAGIAMFALGLGAASAQETPGVTAPAPAAPTAPAPYTPPAATVPAEPAAPTAPAPAETAAAPLPAADDAVAASIASLPTGIEDVQVVGPWIDGDKSGVWRTAMVQVGTGDKESYRFFIQQVEKAAGVATVLTSTEIKEVTGINGAIVGYRADEPTEGDTTGLTLFFDIVPSDGEIAETYELHFQEDRTYTFGPSTN